MTLPQTIRKRRRRRLVWPVVCIMAVSLILAAYLLLVCSNAVYLGWSDALYFLSHPRMWQRFWLTVRTATAAACLSMLVGIPAGYALSRYRFGWPHLTGALIDLPVMVPPAAVGAFLFGFVRTFPMRHICDAAGVQLGHNTAGVIFVQFVVTVAFCSRLSALRSRRRLRSLGFS